MLLGLLAAAGASEIVEVWVYAPQTRRIPLPGVAFSEGRAGDWLRMQASPEGLEALEDAGYPWHPIPPPAPEALEGYHTPGAMIAALDQLAAAHPDLISLVDVGFSTQGRTMVAAVLTASEAPQARWRVVGAHHGDELPTGELSLDLIGALAEGYGADDAITALLDEASVWVLPHANPDGVAAARRYSAAGVDLNRNYSHEWRPDALGAGTAPFSEPETRAMRAMSVWHAFHAGLTLHAGAANIGWVWNHTTQPPPDAALMADLAARFAALTDDPDFWITNGADWYITHGDTTDWTYGRLGTLDFTLEVSVDKTPPAAALPALREKLLPGMLDFLTTPQQVCGLARDGDTARGVPVTVSVGTQPGRSGPQGRFCRLVEAPGPWPVTLTAPGYAPLHTTLSTDDAPRVLPLQPVNLTALRPDPALLSHRGDGWFSLDQAGSVLTLSRPGEEPVLAMAVGDGWQVAVASLAPGPWDLTLDGQAAPRALLVGEPDDRVVLTGVSVQGERITLSGIGLGRGSEVFALAGRDRAPTPLSVVTPAADIATAPSANQTITVDATALPNTDGPTDLLLLSSGYQLAVIDVLGEPILDTPPGDTGDPSGSMASAGVSCSTAPALPSFLLLALPFVLTARRQT